MSDVYNNVMLRCQCSGELERADREAGTFNIYLVREERQPQGQGRPSCLWKSTSVKLSVLYRR